MTTQQLNFKSLPSLPLTQGVTTPNLGLDSRGAWAWSTTLNRPMFWDGAMWTIIQSNAQPPLVTVHALEINVPTAQFHHATVSVNVPWTLPTDRLTAWLAPNPDWDADDLAGYSVACVPKSGVIDFYISGHGPIVGVFMIFYIKGG